MAHGTDEWLEADGLGGFASGSSDLIPRRRYHALLISASKPPINRVALVNAVEVIVKVVDYRGDTTSYPLSSFRFPDKVIHPKGSELLSSFDANLWPHWTFTLPGTIEIECELFMPRGLPMTVLRWWKKGGAKLPEGIASLMIQMRPLLSCRDHHGLHKANPYFSFRTQKTPRGVIWKPYPTLPEIATLTHAEYVHDPLWFYNVTYDSDALRGYECTEDLASPGYFWAPLTSKGVSLVFTAPEHLPNASVLDQGPVNLASSLRQEEKTRRRSFPTPQHKAADCYIVKRGSRHTIIAGYPWFSDWGRDTFISVRGLCIARNRFVEALDIFKEWKTALSHGMIPNLFPDNGDTRPLYNSIDASLWFVVSAYECIKKAPAEYNAEQELLPAILEIVNGYHQGTRFGIKCDEDGLVRGGIRGTQLTWMDAKVGSVVMTPRIGKPVELQALWLNALRIVEEFSDKWKEVRIRGEASFSTKFWNEEQGELFDVIDSDYIPDNSDSSSRPNQILAIGGLPFQILQGEKARKVVDLVERTLYTPHGMRTLTPADRRYKPFYFGGLVDRDRAYHQGTAWPWLLGPFIEAWVRVRDSTRAARREAKQRFITPLLASAVVTPGGHIHEIADGAFPHTPRGCPFQAWSVAEMIRLIEEVIPDELPDKVSTEQVTIENEQASASHRSAPSPVTLRLIRS